MWKPAAALRVSREDREWLETLVGSGKTPQRVALRARIVLGAAAGRPNHALAKELRISRPTLLLWRQRYAEAAGAVAEILKLRPGLTVQQMVEEAWAHSDNATFRKEYRRIAEGVRKAGLPER